MPSALVSEAIEYPSPDYSYVDLGLDLYYNATVLSLHEQLADTLRQLASARLNGSLNQTEYESLTHELGTPLTIIDPLVEDLRVFDPIFANEIHYRISYDAVSREDLWHAWREAALNRIQDILSEF